MDCLRTAAEIDALKNCNGEHAAEIDDIMYALDHLFLTELSDRNHEYLESGFRDYFKKRLDEPGYFYFVVSENVANDPVRAIEEWHLWESRKDRPFVKPRALIH